MSGPQLSYLVALALPTLIVLVACRPATVQMVAADYPLWRQVLACVAELALWAGTVAIATALLAGRRPGGWLMVLLAWHTVWNFLEIAAVGVLWATTAHLDATLLGLLVHNPTLVVAMATSATPRWLLVTLAVVLVLPVVVLAVVGVLVRRRTTSSAVPRRPWTLAGALCLVVAVVVPFALPDRVVAESVPVALMGSTVGNGLQALRGPGHRALVGPAHLQRAGAQRDVLVVFLESTSRQATTLGDPTLATTPRLQALAHTGVEVTRMDAVIPHTSQATTAVLCGTWPKPDTDNAAGGPRGPSRVCLPRLLEERGYRTGWFQSGYTFFENDASMFRNLGFQRVVGREDLHQGHFAKVNYFGLEDDAALPSMERWLRSVPKDRHVMVGTTTLATHHDYAIPDSWVGHWDTANPVRNRYLSALHYSDAYLGHVLDVLRRTGRLDDTVVVVVGDHGEAFGEHGLQLHTGVPYDESLRVPAVIAAPGLAPARIDVPASQVDLLPTVARLAGFGLRGTAYPGVDLLSSAGREPRRQYYDCGYHEVCAGVQEWPWKLVDWFGTKPAELYDVRADPGERDNLAADHPGIVRDLQKGLARWEKEARRPYE